MMKNRFGFLYIVFIVSIFLTNPLGVFAQGPFPDEIADNLLSLNGFNIPQTSFNYDDTEGVLTDAYNVRGSYVQLRIGSSYGAGSIYSIDEDKILILTAAHVLNKYSASEKNYAIFFNGIIGNTRPVYKNKTYDVAIMSVETSIFSSYDLMNLRCVTIDKSAFSRFEKANSKAVFALDSELTVNPLKNQKYDFYGNDTKIAGSYIYGPVKNTSIMVTDFGYKMLYAKCSAHNGMSGGGVFDMKCNFVGILAGGSDNDEMVAVRLSDVITAISDFEAASTDELSGN